jgi:Protein of unknown function (DUF498/DUF598).
MKMVTRRKQSPLATTDVVIEQMDTGAAAGTFHKLICEARQVAATLLGLL